MKIIQPLSITKILRTETGHRLTNYHGKCAHLHGHSYTWEVTVKGSPLINGMVMDFKDLKEILNQTIEQLDHAIVLHLEDPIIQKLGIIEAKSLLIAANDEVPRLFLTEFNPTVENLVSWMWDDVSILLPASVQLDRIKCWETATSFCEKTRD